MRVVGGALRGRPIVAPPGGDTRPTSDRARQAIFNILEHAAWAPELDGLRVVDLFAGSGAMGIEALSRGAASCLFVEQGQAAGAALAHNIGALKLADRARVLKADATRLPPMSPPACDLAFLDPPYGQGLGEAALVLMAHGGWLRPGGVAVLEKGASEPVASGDGFEVLDERRYGAAKVIFLQRRS